MMDPKFSFGVGLGVPKELRMMGQRFLCIVIIFLMSGKDSCGLR